MEKRVLRNASSHELGEGHASEKGNRGRVRSLDGEVLPCYLEKRTERERDRIQEQEGGEFRNSHWIPSSASWKKDG